MAWCDKCSINVYNIIIKEAMCVLHQCALFYSKHKSNHHCPYLNVVSHFPYWNQFFYIFTYKCCISFLGTKYYNSINKDFESILDFSLVDIIESMFKFACLIFSCVSWFILCFMFVHIFPKLILFNLCCSFIICNSLYFNFSFYFDS